MEGEFKLVKCAAVTVSDTRSSENDVSGDVLCELLEAAGASVALREIVSDDLEGLRLLLQRLIENEEIDVVLTTGGTGFGPRDNTPEATKAVIDREAPGIAEAMRRETSVSSPMAMLSRGVAGIKNGTLIVNFPGSPKAVRECFEVVRPILAHAVRIMSGDGKH